MAELTDNLNYLQPTAFKLVINRENYPNIEFFAQSVSHPSVDIAVADVPYSRVNAHMAGDKLTFSELTATVIIDEDMNSYTEMYDWLVRLVEQPYAKVTDQIRGQIPTKADITVSVLSSHNNTNKKIRYIDCIPTGIGNVEFLATTGDIQYLTYTVSFRCTYFEVE